MSPDAQALQRAFHQRCCDPMTAINFALDELTPSYAHDFLSDWRMGDFAEWDDYRHFVLRNAPARRRTHLQFAAVLTGLVVGAVGLGLAYGIFAMAGVLAVPVP